MGKCLITRLIGREAMQTLDKLRNYTLKLAKDRHTHVTVYPVRLF